MTVEPGNVPASPGARQNKKELLHSEQVTVYNRPFSKVSHHIQYAFVLMQQLFFYSSSRNTRDFNHEIRAQSEIWLHREYNLAMKNKSLSYTMLHWSIVTHA